MNALKVLQKVLTKKHKKKPLTTENHKNYK